LGLVEEAVAALQSSLGCHELGDYQESLIRTFGSAVEESRQKNGGAGAPVTLPDNLIPGGTLDFELAGDIRLSDVLLASWHSARNEA
ncbi:MAG TPA: hypothetical protein VK092_08360, partial [Deinococcales bacterium]|nr:hypothetical protein [Deinococcales bacterium]